MDIEIIKQNIDKVLKETNFNFLGEKKVGKVRDTYFSDDKVVLITTDRQSAFDRMLAAVPFKGQVLNQISAWWFERTKHIVPNHVISVPDPNALIDRKATLREAGIHEHILDHSLGVISGGELQRVLIAWALLGNPDVLLFDEPTAGIDVQGEETIYHLLQKLHDSHELTVLLISHDMSVVSQFTNNLLCLDKQMLCFGETAEMLHTQKFLQHQHPHEH